MPSRSSPAPHAPAPARNPYIAGNPVGGTDVFVGRADLLRETAQTLTKTMANAMVLFGQRRIGKTSILQQLASQLPHAGPFRTVVFDLQDKASWSLPAVLHALATRIVSSLDLPFDADENDDDEAAFRERFVPRVLEHLRDEESMVLMFDEFDILDSPSADQAASALFPYLRSLMDLAPERLKFLFVIGRKPEDLTTIALSVFKGVKSKRVSLLATEDAAALVRLSESNGTLRWREDAVARVIELANGHPYITQQLCEVVWNRAYDDDPEEPPVVGPSDVDAAIPEAMESSVHALEWLWNGLAPPERIVASVLAAAGPKPIDASALEQLLVESGVRVVISELQRAPQILQEWELLEPADGGFRFRVELLRRWIAERKPVNRVQSELDEIEPVANSLFQAAYGLYQTGQIEQTTQLLEQALALNPNHLQAGLLLAQTMLAEKRHGDAIAQLQKIYEFNPAAARPRLIQALLEQAEQFDELAGERLDRYERVLLLSPGHPEASERLRAAWTATGDRALAAGDLEVAADAYGRAGLAEKLDEVDARRRDQERDAVLALAAKIRRAPDATKDLGRAIELLGDKLLTVAARLDDAASNEDSPLASHETSGRMRRELDAPMREALRELVSAVRERGARAPDTASPRAKPPPHVEPPPDPRAPLAAWLLGLGSFHHLPSDDPGLRWSSPIVYLSIFIAMPAFGMPPNLNVFFALLYVAFALARWYPVHRMVASLDESAARWWATPPRWIRTLFGVELFYVPNRLFRRYLYASCFAYMTAIYPLAITSSGQDWEPRIFLTGLFMMCLPFHVFGCLDAHSVRVDAGSALRDSSRK